LPKLTEKTIKNPKLPPKGYTLKWDDEVKGFGVRITAGGSVAFIFNYRTRGGRMRRKTIGDVSEYSVEAARRVAKRYRHIVDEGGDPLATQEAERGAPTFKRLAEEYIEKHLPKKRPSSAKIDRQTIDNELLPVLRQRKVAEITFSDIDDLHHKITKRAPYRANRVVALLSKMFSLAIKKGWRTDNPAKGIERNHESKRERYLSNDELTRLTEALAKYPDQDVANAVRLLLMTGARRGEVLSAQWVQFDLEQGVWSKPSAHTKQKAIHTVPLSPPALELLAAMHASRDPNSPYLFPGRDGKGHRVDLKKPWPAICETAGITGLRLHDLRHSYASILASGGTTLLMIGKLLGHTQLSTTLRYAHLQVDPLREATARAGAVIKGAGTAGAEVRKLRR
jgi:integrase